MPAAQVARDGGRFLAVEVGDAAVGRAEDRGVHELRVVAVGLVLEEHLPVGPDLVLQPPGRQLDLVLRRQPGQAVEHRGRRAQVLGETRPLRGETPEHEAVDARHARDPPEAELLLRRRPAIAALERVAEQRAGVAVRPPVVRAAKSAGVAPLRIADQVRPVGAAVEQQVDLTPPVAGHDHRLRPDRLENVVVGLRDLARVPDVDPRPVPDPFQLLGEDRRVRVERAVDAVGSDQLVQPAHAPPEAFPRGLVHALRTREVSNEG